MEARYRASLRGALGDLVQTPISIYSTVYEGEQAFQLQAQCVRCDGHPFYRLDIPCLDHDTLLLILTSIRVIAGIADLGSKNKRIRIGKELEALGIGFMGSWITGHKDGSYTLSIRHIPWPTCREICKVLFSW